MAGQEQTQKKKWDAIKQEGILKAAIRVITQSGVHGLTMEAVAQEAGISKGALYIYFDSKELLVHSAIESSLTDLKSSLGKVFESDSPADRKITYMIHRMIMFFEANRDLFRILLYERQKMHGSYPVEEHRGYSNFLKALDGLYSEGVESGLFRRMDATKAAALIAEMCMALISHRLLVDSSQPPEEDAQLLTRFLMHGISTEGQAG